MLEIGFFDGQVKIKQPTKGYRAGTDAILLASSIIAKENEMVLELGCGSGIVMLLASFHNKSAQFTGLEKSEEMLELARQNTRDNKNIKIVSGSIRNIPKNWHLKYDQLMANPPYFDDRRAVRMPKNKQASFVNKKGIGLNDWVAAMLLTLKPRGIGTLIYRADGLEKLMSLLYDKVGKIRILPIHSYSDQAAKRVLVQFRKGVKSESAILPALIMHERGSDKRYSAHANDILQGRRRLELT